LKRLLFKITYRPTTAESKFAITDLGGIQLIKTRDIESPYTYVDPSGRVILYATGEGSKYVIIVVWNYKDRAFSAWRTENMSDSVMEVSSLIASVPKPPFGARRSLPRRSVLVEATFFW
jgi:hypothetical protein